MTEKKATRKELFARIAWTMADDPEVVELCRKSIAAIDKPRVSKKSFAALNFALEVRDMMSQGEEDEVFSAAQIAEKMEVSTQKAAGALRMLVNRDEVERIEGGKVIMYKLK